MEKNIIITILPSLFLKLFDELSDNPNKYITLNKYKKLIVIITFIVTILYSMQGSGYCFLLFIHGVFCALEKQLDHNYYTYGMIILFAGILLNDKEQLQKLITTKIGITYLVSTFVFVFIEEKLFPEEVSKIKVISRILIIISGIIHYIYYVRHIKDNELRIIITGNLSASIVYYSTSVIMKLYTCNPFNDRENFLEGMIKRVYNLIFKDILNINCNYEL